MRESFVFHECFINGVPEDRRDEFTRYAIEYGLYDREPELSGMDAAFFTTVKKFIDDDRRRYEKRVEYLEQYRKNKKNDLKHLKHSECSSTSENIQNTNVYVNDNVNVNENENVNVNDNDNVNENVNVNDNDAQAQSAMSDGQVCASYIMQLYDKWKGHGLKCSKTPLEFMQKEFKAAQKSIKGIHSDDVLKAIDNYVEVLRSSSTWVTSELWFDTFCCSKLFRDFLPDNYSFKAFKKASGTTKGVKDDNPVEVLF